MSVQVKIDIDFKPARRLVEKAVEDGSLVAARLVKKRSDQKIHVGKIKRNVYKKGKYKGKAWTSRRPGRLKKTGRAYKSKYSGGGAIVMYGSFLAYYGFMHHWGVKNKYGKKIPANKFLADAQKEARSEINREISSRIKKNIK